MINRAEYRSSSIVAVKSCTEATCSIKAQNLLRHKPITLQDALPKSNPSRDNLPRPDPLSLAETSPLSSSQSRLSKPLYKRSRSIDNQSRSLQ
ncbi:hypothetical protein V6N13_009098 [Hibiscus sabdariffa]